MGLLYCQDEFHQLSGEDNEICGINFGELVTAETVVAKIDKTIPIMIRPVKAFLDSSIRFILSHQTLIQTSYKFCFKLKLDCSSNGGIIKIWASE
jgi:hypothetical protein